MTKIDFGKVIQDTYMGLSLLQKFQEMEDQEAERKIETRLAKREAGLTLEDGGAAQPTSPSGAILPSPLEKPGGILTLPNPSDIPAEVAAVTIAEGAPHLANKIINKELATFQEVQKLKATVLQTQRAEADRLLTSAKEQFRRGEIENGVMDYNKQAELKGQPGIRATGIADDLGRELFISNKPFSDGSIAFSVYNSDSNMLERAFYPKGMKPGSVDEVQTTFNEQQALVEQIARQKLTDPTKKIDAATRKELTKELQDIARRNHEAYQEGQIDKAIKLEKRKISETADVKAEAAKKRTQAEEEARWPFTEKEIETRIKKAAEERGEDVNAKFLRNLASQVGRSVGTNVVFAGMPKAKRDTLITDIINTVLDVYKSQRELYERGGLDALGTPMDGEGDGGASGGEGGTQSKVLGIYDPATGRMYAPDAYKEEEK